MPRRRQPYMETLRVVQTALDHRTRMKRDAYPSELLMWAKAERGSFHAALVTVLRLGLNAKNQPVKLSDRWEVIYVHDPDTRRALLQLGRRRVRVGVDGVYRPW